MPPRPRRHVAPSLPSSYSSQTSQLPSGNGPVRLDPACGNSARNSAEFPPRTRPATCESVAAAAVEGGRPVPKTGPGRADSGRREGRRPTTPPFQRRARAVRYSPKREGWEEPMATAAVQTGLQTLPAADQRVAAALGRRGEAARPPDHPPPGHGRPRADGPLQPPPGGQHRQALRQPRPVPAGPDRGGEHRPAQGRRGVRPGERLPVQHLRVVVDQAGDQAGADQQRPADPHPGLHGRDDDQAEVRHARAGGQARPARQHRTSWPPT